MVISLFHGLLLTVPSRLETKRVSESSLAKRQMYLVAQSVRLFATLWTVACQTPSPWDFSGIFFISFSRGSSCPNDGTHIPSVSCIAGKFFTHCAIGCCSFSPVRLFSTPGIAAHQASLSFTISQSLLKLMSIESVMPSNHLILCRPLLLLPSIFPSISVFSDKSVLHITWPKYWSFCFSINHSNEYSGRISFRIDCFYLLAAQGTLKSLIQHHCLKASILQGSAFFTVQLSHPYMTTRKTIALTIQIFVSKVMCLLFNILSRLVIAFLRRSSIF